VAELDSKFDKATILEFYLNQVPHAAQRRGVQQAATFCFDRDVATLNKREMLALAVLLVRAPSHFDLEKAPHL
jgi:penicillin-binding protein 1C